MVETPDKYKHHFLCSPDGLVNDDTTLEIKWLCAFEYYNGKKIFIYFYKDTFNFLSRKPWKKIKHFYIPQTQTQMLSTGRQKSIISANTATNGCGFFKTKFQEDLNTEMHKTINYVFKHLMPLRKDELNKEDPFEDYSGYEHMLKLINNATTDFEYDFIDKKEQSKYYLLFIK